MEGQIQRRCRLSFLAVRVDGGVGGGDETHAARPVVGFGDVCVPFRAAEDFDDRVGKVFGGLSIPVIGLLVG